MSNETCTLRDLTVRPDYYYMVDENGQPTGERLTDGGEYLYYCNNCGDISYLYETAKQHIYCDICSDAPATHFGVSAPNCYDHCGKHRLCTACYELGHIREEEISNT